ncbi:MAG TPA: universal stress protein [Anaerolineae bacterium]|nr:universal stress protein [Anaerolineae bacterium]
MFRFTKILVPLDGSEFAERALGPALSIAEPMEAEMVLFRVAQPIPRTQALAAMPDVYEDVVAAAYREAESYLRQVRARLAYPRLSIEHRAGEDGVARQILDFAAQSGVDLVVMSSHGRTGVQRWMYGSVAEKILNGCSCSTLIIHCWQDQESPRQP